MTLLGFLQKQCQDNKKATGFLIFGRKKLSFFLSDAPPLLEFTKDNYEYTFTFDKDFVYDILYSFDNNIVGEFIGKIINEMFLKENKEDQSMFATDYVRLNYSIKEYINENKNRWAKKAKGLFSAGNQKPLAFYCPVLDKGANKVTKIIINPLLLYFIKELKLHLQKENNKMMLSGTKKSDDYIDSDNDIKQIEYKEESESASASESDANNTNSDKSSEGWRTPKKESDSEKSNDSDSDSDSNDSDSNDDSDSDKQKKEELEDNDDYMTRPIKTNKDKEKSDSTEKSLTIPNKAVSLFVNPDKIKNPHKYHKELTVKERDLIIKQSTKIMEFIKAIEDGTVAKDVLKFITKFYQLDKTYFE